MESVVYIGPVDAVVGSPTIAIQARDVNGDGRLDLVVCGAPVRLPPFPDTNEEVERRLRSEVSVTRRSGNMDGEPWPESIRRRLRLTAESGESAFVWRRRTPDDSDSR